MDTLFYKALDLTDVAVVIIDSNKKIKFWNSKTESISNVEKELALEKSLLTICPKFSEDKYVNLLDNVFDTLQSKFCSAALHKAFVYPSLDINSYPNLRQNLRIEPILIDKEIFLLLQFVDVTKQLDKEKKLTNFIKELEIGYNEVKIEGEKNRFIANIDPLTKLYNRNSFEIELSKSMSLASENNTLLGVFFIDIDGFKQVNDTHGHLVGDKLLIYLANCLKNNIKGTDIVARIGGDEFVILLNSIKFKTDIEGVAKRLLSEVSKPIFIDNISTPISVTASIGISIFPLDSTDKKDIIDLADKSMYSVKKLGKNSFKFS